MTYLALKNFPVVIQTPPVAAESLTTFLKQERKGIATVLDRNERWARQHLPYYPPLPSTLRFDKTSSSQKIREAFLHSIRINPNAKIPLYLHTIVVDANKLGSCATMDQEKNSIACHRIFDQKPKPNRPLLAISKVSLVQSISNTLGKATFRALKPGELVSALQVVTTASDEPDYGFDIGLWQNNGTKYGRLYHWGKQPFGDAHFSFDSQAPFHMAFWHEDHLAYWVAPYLHRTYPQYRLHTYLALSKFAFRTHHDYWGWRFLGWAIHYAQDLGQPYHSTMTPGENTAKVIFYAALSKIGYHSGVRNIIQCVTNRHLVLEVYIARTLNRAIFKEDSHNILYRALSHSFLDEKIPPFQANYLQQVVSVESHEFANSIDQQIQVSFPKRYTRDPHFTFTNLDAKAYYHAKQDQLLNKLLARLLREIGDNTRELVQWDLHASLQEKK